MGTYYCADGARAYAGPEDGSCWRSWLPGEEVGDYVGNVLVVPRYCRPKGAFYGGLLFSGGAAVWFNADQLESAPTLVTTFGAFAQVDALEWSVHDPALLVAALNGGPGNAWLYRSTDGGLTWAAWVQFAMPLVTGWETIVAGKILDVIHRGGSNWSLLIGSDWFEVADDFAALTTLLAAGNLAAVAALPPIGAESSDRDPTPLSIPRAHAFQAPAFGLRALASDGSAARISQFPPNPTGVALVIDYRATDWLTAYPTAPPTAGDPDPGDGSSLSAPFTATSHNPAAPDLVATGIAIPAGADRNTVEITVLCTDTGGDLTGHMEFQVLETTEGVPGSGWSFGWRACVPLGQSSSGVPVDGARVFDFTSTSLVATDTLKIRAISTGSGSATGRIKVRFRASSATALGRHLPAAKANDGTDRALPSNGVLVNGGNPESDGTSVYGLGKDGRVYRLNAGAVATNLAAAPPAMGLLHDPATGAMVAYGSNGTFGTGGVWRSTDGLLAWKRVAGPPLPDLTAQFVPTQLGIGSGGDCGGRFVGILVG